MTLVLQWRIPAPGIVTRWRGPGGMMPAIRRDPLAPVAAVVGPPGPPGETAIVGINAIAAEAIGGHRAVTFGADGRALLADHRTLTAGAAIGLSTHAVIAGGTLNVQFAGPVEESGWTWSPGPVFVGENGVISQVPPASGVLVQIGMALGPTKLIVAPCLVVQF